MDALILSCSTGGGHNAAGAAIREELEARGHHVVMMDPYELVGKKTAVTIGNVYIKMVQRSPKSFGVLYFLGSVVRRIPGKSPIYHVNYAAAKRLREYLKRHHFDVILMPHLYPAELITHLKRSGEALPLCIFVATDYTCIPFTEETDCDYYVIPGEAQRREFIKRGIPEEQLLPFGIPTAPAFDMQIDKRLARKELGLHENGNYILLTGGSIGAGSLKSTIRILLKLFQEREKENQLIVICGNNEKLYRKLSRKYRNRLILIQRTHQMALYMRACDLFISKPGGLSSTEAAVMCVPYIQITPIPGCETRNMRFFSKTGMSYAVPHPRRTLKKAVIELEKKENRSKMEQCQKEGLAQKARTRICDWIEQKLQSNINV